MPIFYFDPDASDTIDLLDKSHLELKNTLQKVYVYPLM